MAEWPNVPDSKSGVAQVTVGSNPTLSAKLMLVKRSAAVTKRRPFLLQQSLRACQMTGLRAAFDIEPAKQAPQVNFDGVLADL